MATYETDAIVLRAIRYSEADSILTLYTRDRGRASAIAKGARRPRSRLGARLQPGTCGRFMLAEGRGDLATVRGVGSFQPNAGLWVASGRLRAAGSVLEAAYRTLPEQDPNEPAYHLLDNALVLIAREPPPEGPPRLDPFVLGVHVKLLVVAGLLPVLGSCARCGAGPPLPAFSAVAGGALCPGCADGADPFSPATHAALAGLIGRPLGEAREACPSDAAPGVERVVGLVLREHLGVTLRSASPSGMWETSRPGH